eukprot:3819774-Pyramimonas_sp.AAC.1
MAIALRHPFSLFFLIHLSACQPAFLRWLWLCAGPRLVTISPSKGARARSQRMAGLALRLLPCHSSPFIGHPPSRLTPHIGIG